MLLPAPGWTQEVAGPKANVVAPDAGRIKIVVVQGEGALNNIKARTATAPVVEIRDDNDKPVAGAEVVFQLPVSGPGGVFNGWMRTQTTRTDAQGRAAATGMTPNDEEGRFNIKVTAHDGKRSASTVIAQSNSRTGGNTGQKADNSHKKVLIVLGILAVAGIVGGIAGTRGADSGGGLSSSPVTIAPGPVTVGAPR